MPTFPYMLVDAFTDRPLAGNPCAVLFDTDDLSEGAMQAIAREMNLSETAFVRRSNVADFGVRYFTPVEEIPLAGHPTIATTVALIDSGRLALQGFTDEGRTAARHFGTPPDTLEDPFTGSATGGMAAYLWRHGLIEQPRFIAEQGHNMHRPGQAAVEIIGSRDDIQAVKVGGSAVVVIRGELTLL